MGRGVADRDQADVGALPTQIKPHLHLFETQKNRKRYRLAVFRFVVNGDV